MSGLPSYVGQLGDMKKRVGLIGTGWYGKSDLLRLVQVAPVDVVSLCDVDKQMVSDAADLVATRQLSKKRPRIYSDYRAMLKERDLDIVLVGTPDHWHALPMIEAVKSGVDVWVQKPISVDVVEGQAMLAAARKYKRVVQVGMQRRSTPHLIHARDRVIKEGKLGTIGLVEICCYYHMRATQNPPDGPPPANLDYEMWTGPAPMRPYNSLVHPRSWRAFMEYGNGIVGDMCVHMLDMVRWMLDLGMPTRISSTGGIFVDKKSKANITDTQTATFEFPNLRVVWNHRSYGSSPDAELSVGRDLLRRQGHAQGQRQFLRFHPAGQGRGADSRGRRLRARAVPRGQDREGPRAARRAGHSRAHEELPRVHRVARHAGCRHRAGIHVGRPPASSPTCRWISAARSSGITPRASSSATRRRTSGCAGRIERRGCTPSQGRSRIPVLSTGLEIRVSSWSRSKSDGLQL